MFSFLVEFNPVFDVFLGINSRSFGVFSCFVSTLFGVVVLFLDVCQAVHFLLGSNILGVLCHLLELLCCFDLLFMG